MLSSCNAVDGGLFLCVWLCGSSGGLLHTLRKAFLCRAADLPARQLD